MSNLFTQMIKNHFEANFKVLDVFEHQYETIQTLYNYTIFIDYEGIVVFANTSFSDYSEQTPNEIINELEEALFLKTKKWDEFFYCRMNFDEIDDSKKDFLFWLIEDMAYILKKLCIVETPWDSTEFSNALDILLKIYGYNIKSATKTYQAVMKSLVISNEELFMKLKIGYELPPELRI